MGEIKGPGFDSKLSLGARALSPWGLFRELHERGRFGEDWVWGKKARRLGRKRLQAALREQVLRKLEKGPKRPPLVAKLKSY